MTEDEERAYALAHDIRVVADDLESYSFYSEWSYVSVQAAKIERLLKRLKVLVDGVNSAACDNTSYQK